MSAGIVTEREAVRRERLACAKARCAILAERSHLHGGWPYEPCDTCKRKAVERFPLPKVVRPRVVTEPDTDRCFRIHEGQMQTREPECFGGRWVCMESTTKLSPDEGDGTGTGIFITPARVALWAELLANPTEEVSDD